MLSMLLPALMGSRFLWGLVVKIYHHRADLLGRRYAQDGKQLRRFQQFSSSNVRKRFAQIEPLERFESIPQPFSRPTLCGIPRM